MFDINNQLKNIPFTEKAIEVKQKPSEHSGNSVSENINTNEPSSIDISDNTESVKTYPSGNIISEISFPEKNESVEKQIINKQNPTEQDLKVLEFISEIKNKTLDEILKSFDKMLEHARKLQEQNKIYTQKVLIPKEEAMKKQIQLEESQKQKA
jgi:hypothetical protein